IRIENVKILSRGVAHNDGIDIDGSQHVVIKNCDVNSGDDALCFKTTSSTMACSDIRVSGMRLKSSQGAIKMGTESMAPFENIKISDCYIYETNNGGIKLLTVDGAHLRNVEISNITMVDVRTPILVRLGSRLSVFRKSLDTKQETGTLEKVVIKNVKAKASDSAQLKPPSGILITGVPGHYITDLTLENIEIDLLGDGTVENSRQVVTEAIDKYPEVKTFGPIIPAYGVWARHVKGLKLKHITFRLKHNDLRPAFLIEDGKDIEITNCKIPKTSGAQSIVRLENVDGAKITRTEVQGSADAFVRVEGNDSKKIKVENNKTATIKKNVELAPGVKSQVIVSK
ncbi:MAG TPA: glycosyl hydrolase family 28 protein, partial [Chitinophagaceae bacterium]|nr:glycosyl hydrolase family 28 protein [Chitinophagaceae bacterium]